MTVKELAAKFEVSAYVIYHWIDRKLLIVLQKNSYTVVAEGLFTRGAIPISG